MNTRFIEAFLQIARLKSFRAAADSLHLTQAAISSRIASLEEEVGAKLIERDARDLRLTAAGIRLLEYGEQMLALEKKIQRLGSVSDDVTGLVRIGAVDSVIHTWLIDFLKSLQTTYPGITIQLTSESTASVQRMVKEGCLDIALHAHTVDGEGSTSIACLPIALGWICQPGTSADPKNALERILSAPVITMGRGSHPDHVLGELYRRVGLAPVKIHRVSSIAAILQLVAAGFGCALLPLAAVRPAIESGQVQVIDCGIALPSQPLMVSYSAANEVGKIRAIAELACQECDRFVRALPARYSVK
ncbi:LysR family transcriptional regulator [Bordetella genomosp. 10]|uniref:LysR family transcriptional regulator n=1 Tax=Bordetella genomosp. 10 TaxID=1416804 RepID=A0A261S1T1_9BORD|nr:LysR family transcriptional regulator [Bordetella genomosp. 10]OZI31101.1 LysR family transcriptional regulator [Bordetella genomosp. 10]